ncbi:hypothetical protein JOM56_009113 [Amanita muscaria]
MVLSDTVSHKLARCHKTSPAVTSRGMFCRCMPSLYSYKANGPTSAKYIITLKTRRPIKPAGHQENATNVASRIPRCGCIHTHSLVRTVAVRGRYIIILQAQHRNADILRFITKFHSVKLVSLSATATYVAAPPPGQMDSECLMLSAQFGPCPCTDAVLNVKTMA